jgi:hypothetical protein
MLSEMPDVGGRVAAKHSSPLVATWARWALSAGAVFLALFFAGRGFLLVTRPQATPPSADLDKLGRTLASVRQLSATEMDLAVAILCAIVGAWVFAMLRAEESRLARELRTARTASAVLRGVVSRRRQRAPFLSRLFATRLGAAALQLADGDRDSALAGVAGGSPFMQGGRLAALRAVIEADLDRATATVAGRERCVERLRAMQPTGNREADLYRVHVLVKALLEQGDTDGAFELALDLEPAKDEELRVYGAWLRVWFDFDELTDYRHAWPPLKEGELRLALLLARGHGAAKLVEKLEHRLSAIARPELSE